MLLLQTVASTPIDSLSFTRQSRVIWLPCCAARHAGWIALERWLHGEEVSPGHATCAPSA